MTQLPHPQNPQHVENLASLSLLETQGFEGQDMSLAECIFVYGMAWRTLDNGEMLVIYRHPTIQGRFDRSTIAKDYDVQREHDWADFNAISNYTGTPLDEWHALPAITKLCDLVSYYGIENVFGSSYWEGFEISEE